MHSQQYSDMYVGREREGREREREREGEDGGRGKEERVEGIRREEGEKEEEEGGWKRQGIECHSHPSSDGHSWTSAPPAQTQTV